MGEAVSVTLMWGDVPGFVYLPYALQHPRLTLGLSNLLQDNLYAKFGGKSETNKSQDIRVLLVALYTMLLWQESSVLSCNRCQF